MKISYPLLDDFEQLLLIYDEEEMNSKILNNFPRLTKFFKNILQRIKEEYIPEREINSFIYSLKFIDNLNLFIDDTKLKTFKNFMKDINSKLKKNKNIDYESKERIIERIKYTELTFIKNNKEYFRNLYFNNPNEIAKEIEYELEKVNKKGYFDAKQFQQIQNIYWILKNRIENVKDKEFIENKIKNIKKTTYYDNYYDIYYYDNSYNNNCYNNHYSNNYYYKNNSYGYNKNKNYYDNKNYYKGHNNGNEYYKSQNHKKYNNYNNNYYYKNNEAVEIIDKANDNENIKDELTSNKNNNINNKIIIENENNSFSLKEDININKANTKDIINQVNPLQNEPFPIKDFYEIENINKIKININLLDNNKENKNKEEFIDKNKRYFKNIIYKIMNNIHDYYSNYNKFEAFLNDIIKEDNRRDDLIFRRKYIQIDKQEIKEFYKKFLTDFKEVKSKEKKHLQKEFENKLIETNDLVEKALIKLNIPQILKEALEEIGKEEFGNNNNIINERSKKDNSLINNNNFSFDYILKIVPYEKKIQYEKLDIKKKVIIEDSLDSLEKNKDEDKKISSKEYIFYTDKILNYNTQIISKSLSNKVEEYKQNKENKNISLIDYIISKDPFDLKNEDLNEYNEYMVYKILIMQNRSYMSINLQIFEKYFLLPLYHNILVNSLKKYETFNYILEKYKKIINSICKSYDVIEEISAYGSLINNFLEEKGDIDICIVPKCPWFKFYKYAHKIINKIKNKNIGKIKLFHKAKSFILITIYDEETKSDLDITIHNLLPILNSRLIKLYSNVFI